MAEERKRDVREPELSDFFSHGRAVDAGQDDFTPFNLPIKTPPHPHQHFRLRVFVVFGPSSLPTGTQTALRSTVTI